MKRIHQIRTIMLITAFLLLTASAASAASLTWNASSGEVTGYKVYYGTTAGSPTSSVDVGKTTSYAIDKLPLNQNTQYYLCVSAYNAAGESPRCTPVAYKSGDTTPPAPPSGLISK